MGSTSTTTTTSTPMRYYIYTPPRVRRPASSLARGEEDAGGARRREGVPGERAMSTRRASALRHMSATAVRRWSSSTSWAKKGAPLDERRRSRAEAEAERGGRLDNGGDDGVVTLVVVDGRNNGDGGKRDVNGDVRFVASVGRRRAAPGVVFVDEASFSSP
jgi:hypothetical protein